MTTIAWDGKTLAADKRATGNLPIAIITKIFRLVYEDHHYLIGAEGEINICNQLTNWARQGFKESMFSGADTTVTKARMLVIKDDYTIQVYGNNSYYPYAIQNTFYALGSGRGYAIGAMHCGKNAIEAVEIASLYDHHTGNGIDILTF